MILNVGVDYHNMAVGDREIFSLSPDQLPGIYRDIKSDFPQTVFLSTCNRMEVYFSGLPESLKVMVDWLASRFISWGASSEKIEELKSKFYHHRGQGAVKHLLEVAAGLHSMVVGENQILHQIKRAYQDADTHLTLDAEFHKLFQTALGLGKKVRTQTDIGKGGMSLGSVSVDIIKKLYEKDSQFTVVLIGAGEIAEEVLKSLINHGRVRIGVCNRDPQRAQKLLSRYQGFFTAEYIPFEERYRAVAEANVTVVSTNASEYVLTKPELEKALGGHYRFSFFIDLSVPRNIDPEVTDLQDLVVYTLDDLDEIISKNYSQRSSQVNLCHNLIEEQIQDFQIWMHKRRFFLVKQECEQLLGDINREREENHLEVIPEEKLEIFFENYYQKILAADREEMDLLQLPEILTKSFLTTTLETVHLPDSYTKKRKEDLGERD